MNLDDLEPEPPPFGTPWLYRAQGFVLGVTLVLAVWVAT